LFRFPTPGEPPPAVQVEQNSKKIKEINGFPHEIPEKSAVLYDPGFPYTSRRKLAERGRCSL
jgi:hypothetical protein